MNNNKSKKGSLMKHHIGRNVDMTNRYMETIMLMIRNIVPQK